MILNKFINLMLIFIAIPIVVSSPVSALDGLDWTFIGMDGVGAAIFTGGAVTLNPIGMIAGGAIVGTGIVCQTLHDTLGI
jgi:1,4-dihydroxy-2-naphthoate octaprenyltransferase